MNIIRPDTHEQIEDIIREMRYVAQNNEMVDSYYTDTGKMLNRMADELERHIKEAA